jgi:Flp pilus assembly protein TadB
MEVVVLLAGALVAGGLAVAVTGLVSAPPSPPGPPRRRSRLRRWSAVSPRGRVLLLVGVTIGAVVAVLTGWVLAVVVVPAALVGFPALVSAPPARREIARLEALEEWTRSLSGVLTTGVGLEQAVIATNRSTPEPIRPEVARLVARLRARWSTEDALRAWAEDIDDATGDVVAAALILGARRRGVGLAAVLEGLAASVSDDVRSRRAVEADRARPRSTARWVTLISAGALAVLALSGAYVAPYGSAVGQVILAVLLTGYAATLLWMRRMAATPPSPRFLGSHARAAVAGLAAGVGS